MKSFMKWIGKVCVAGIIALLILSLFSLYYYSHGIRKTTTTGATDYSWENKVWSLGYEGHAFGVLDEDGFNNYYDVDKDNIDILIMGSSQMNANNVMSKQSTSYLLNSKLEEDGLSVYNIGMEGHDFYICADNLDDALKTYHPNKYVIIESRYASFTMEEMDVVLDGTRMRGPAYDSGIIYYLQKIPYLRLLHRQIRNMGLMQDTNLVDSEMEILDGVIKQISDEGENVGETDEESYEEKMNRLYKKLADEATEYGVQLVVFYMPIISIEEDGSISMRGDADSVKQQKEICEANGVVFVDMTDCFLEHYEENYAIPFGFSNSEIGEGHLNKVGHQMVAQELYETIIELEDEEN